MKKYKFLLFIIFISATIFISAIGVNAVSVTTVGADVAVTLADAAAGVRADIADTATDADIILTYVPNIGSTGSVTGYVILPDGLNYGDYAVIAILDTIIYGQYVKPTYANYLTNISMTGTFSANIYSNSSDAQYDVFYLYIVKKSDFTGVSGESINSYFMEGKYLIRLNCKKSDNTPPPVPSVEPGFVTEGTRVTVDVPAAQAHKRGTFYYTTDGTDPGVSATRRVYTPGTEFTVYGTLIIKIINVYNARPSELATFTYLPNEGQPKPFRGLNFSPNITESFSYELSRATVRTRLEAVAPYTQWIRTFTTTTGLQYANAEAKSFGLKTMIGIYLSDESTQAGKDLNAAQISSLKNMLREPSPPDLICVGNEMSISGISDYDALLQKYLTLIRQLVSDEGLIIPIGIADIYGYDPGPGVAGLCDYYGFNYYPSVWDRSAPEDSVTLLDEYYNIGKRSNKMIVVSEYGYPDEGSAYTVENGTINKPAPKKEDAVAALNEFMHWQKNNNVLGFYFQCFKQNAKTGFDIERNFGLMGSDLMLFPHYAGLIADFQSGKDYTFYKDGDGDGSGDGAGAIISSHKNAAQNVGALFVYTSDGYTEIARHYVYADVDAYKTVKINDPYPIPGAVVKIYDYTEPFNYSEFEYRVFFLPVYDASKLARIQIYNDSDASGLSRTLYVAAYKNSKLVYFISNPIALSESESTVIDIASGEFNYLEYDTLKAYIWDSDGRMSPLAETAVKLRTVIMEG